MVPWAGIKPSSIAKCLCSQINRKSVIVGYGLDQSEINSLEILKENTPGQVMTNDFILSTFLIVVSYSNKPHFLHFNLYRRREWPCVQCITRQDCCPS